MNLVPSFLTTTTQKLMDGVIILETETLCKESLPLAISIGTITLLFLIASIVSVISDYDWNRTISPTSFLFSVFTGLFLIIELVLFMNLSEESPIIQHTVFVENSAAIPELYETYEVISHETNDVWIIREKK